MLGPRCRSRLFEVPRKVRTEPGQEYLRDGDCAVDLLRATGPWEGAAATSTCHFG